MRPVLCALLILGIAGNYVWSWGQNGHRIVAELAQRQLSPEASNAITALLNGRNLADISTEPDDWRSDPRWACAAPFHYVTRRVGATYPDATVPEWPNGDAIRGVYFLSDVLLDQQSSAGLKREALAYLVHLVGDLHQPLHVGRGCDRGGNSVRVTWRGDERNLHSVWDEALIESENLSYSEYVGRLERKPLPSPEAVAGAGPIVWMNDAQQHFDQIYACDVRDGCACFCGDCSDGLSTFGGCQAAANCRLQMADRVVLGFGYVFRIEPIVDLQLRRGGHRLAHLLESIFSENRLPPDYLELAQQLQALQGWDSALQQCFRP